VSTRNEEQLTNFTEFCRANPELRFYQALRAWSGYGAIFVADDVDGTGLKDTFYWEGRRDPSDLKTQNTIEATSLPTADKTWYGFSCSDIVSRDHIKHPQDPGGKTGSCLLITESE
jgi:hypothetical protein